MATGSTSVARLGWLSGSCACGWFPCMSSAIRRPVASALLVGGPWWKEASQAITKQQSCVSVFILNAVWKSDTASNSALGMYSLLVLRFQNAAVNSSRQSIVQYSFSKPRISCSRFSGGANVIAVRRRLLLLYRPKPSVWSLWPSIRLVMLDIPILKYDGSILFVLFALLTPSLQRLPSEFTDSSKYRSGLTSVCWNGYPLTSPDERWNKEDHPQIPSHIYSQHSSRTGG